MAIDQYLNLITSEHRNKPKFIGWLSAALQKVDDGMTMVNSIPSAFDIDKAIGAQLDVLGTIIGQLRDIGVPLTGASSILDDNHYRLVLKAKIARNQWDGTIGQVYDIWNGAFPGSALQIIDNQNMSMQAVVTNLTDNLDTELVTAGLIIPKPMGVTLIIIADTAISDSPYLGMIVTTDDTYSLYTNSLTSVYKSTILADKPVAYYRLDEISGTIAVDSSGNAHNGTITGGVTLGQSGAIADNDQAMSFDGSTGYIGIKNQSALQITGSMTIEMWIKPTALSANQNPWNKSYLNEGAITIEAQGYWDYYYGNGTNSQDFTIGTKIVANQWNHIVVVRDLGAMTLTAYLNGAQVATTTASYAVSGTSTSDVLIGDGYANFFDGAIDEVAIYNYALTASQVQAHYSASSKAYTQS